MLNENLIEALTFDDVLLVPQRSSIRSRFSGEIDTSARVARGAPAIHIPIISANMDTVTDWRMATTMSLLGGFGVLPDRKTSSQVRLGHQMHNTLSGTREVRV